MHQTNHKIIFGNSQRMPEVANSTVHLMVTSPPYPMIKMWDTLFADVDPKLAKLWQQITDYCSEETITEIYQELHLNLAKVWSETYRVLVDGGIACINIGDATRKINNKFRLFPNHSKIIEHCEQIGFITLPYILWKKPTTKPQYKGKGAFLGSGFLPPNAYVTLDCEYILIFRKGNLRQFPSRDPNRYDSAITKKQRDEWFSQIWALKGTRQTTSQLERRTAAFPDEIVNRIVKMFSVKGDNVLDPFLGSGTTTRVAMQAERNSIGYEKDPTLIPLVKSKVGYDQNKKPEASCKISIIHRVE